MATRKQRINVMLHPDTLDRLEAKVPGYQRSEYIEGLIRKDLNMSAVESKQKGFAVYTKSIDYGQGVQTVYANDGKIVSQSIGAAEGLYHSYTGDGNPEWVGQDVSVLRGQGFTRLRNKNRLDELEMEWLQEGLEG